MAWIEEYYVKIKKIRIIYYMKYLIIFILLFIVLWTLQNKQNTTVSALSSDNTILALGDSLTYGYNAHIDESYPSILSQLSGYKVINAGINGETSAKGLQRLPKLLEDKYIKLMLLCFGGNDIIQHLSMSQLKKNLKTMIAMAKEKDIAVLLISVPNFTLFGLSPLELYEEVADEMDVPLASGILADILSQPSLKSDQIHPNALGYKMMGEKIYEKLREEGFIN